MIKNNSKQLKMGLIAVRLPKRKVRGRKEKKESITTMMTKCLTSIPAIQILKKNLNR